MSFGDVCCYRFWLWTSARRSSRTWTMLRRSCMGMWYWRTTASCCPWVRETPKPLPFDKDSLYSLTLPRTPYVAPTFPDKRNHWAGGATVLNNKLHSPLTQAKYIASTQGIHYIFYQVTGEYIGGETWFSRLMESWRGTYDQISNSHLMSSSAIHVCLLMSTL